MLYTVIRYSEMNYRGFFKVSDDISPKSGEFCIVKSPRGIEIGKILCECLTHEGDVLWLKNSRSSRAGKGDEGSQGDVLRLSGEILRLSTPEDQEKAARQRMRGTREEIDFCSARIREHQLKMKLAGVEYLFEGEKIIFYFLAEGRVDFRSLVRDLAKKYRTRIEMKQIGVRDEARLLAEYEHCGRRLCCKNFLNNLEPVTMRMAKCQKTTLDPSKISGRCGRLMCCLRYEDNVYQELRGRLPKKGKIITLKEGRAKVLSQDVLLQKLVVETESGDRQIISVEEVTGIEPPRGPGQKKAQARPEGEKGEKREQHGRGRKEPRGRKDQRGRKGQRGRGGASGGRSRKDGGEQTNRSGKGEQTNRSEKGEQTGCREKGEQTSRSGQGETDRRERAEQTGRKPRRSRRPSRSSRKPRAPRSGEPGEKRGSGDSPKRDTRPTRESGDSPNSPNNRPADKDSPPQDR
jgi:cell fate regulator YaaT (PSP1 superfamily)